MKMLPKQTIFILLSACLALSNALPAHRTEETPINPLVLLPSDPNLNERAHPEDWELLAFKNIQPTIYRWSSKENSIHAVSDSSASGLIYRLEGDAAERPILRWRWRIVKTLPKGNAYERSGDDYAARIHVTFKYDDNKAGWTMRLKYRIAKKLYGEQLPYAGINYVWANRMPQGESINSAYTDRVRMVAVRSGNDQIGTWLSEERNILEDYRKLFGGEPPSLAGIAIMTDTDDTKGHAEAWYANITLSPDADNRESENGR